MKHARKDYDRIQDPQNIIPKDEPVFLFRGQDVYAPLVLEFYALLVEQGKDPDLNVVMNTRNHAVTMRVWQHKIRKKQPDMPVEESVY